MYVRTDGTRARRKGERAHLAKGESLAGSQSRNSKGGARERRGAQAEQEASQRYHPDDFEVDKSQRLRVIYKSSAPQAVAFGCTASMSTSLTKIALSSASSSVGTDITVDATNDHIALKGGSAYMVEVQFKAKNNNAGAERNFTLAIVGSDDTTYAVQTQQIARKATNYAFREDLWITGVVDLQRRAGLNVEIQASATAAGATEVSGVKGWGSVQKL